MVLLVDPAVIYQYLSFVGLHSENIAFNDATSIVNIANLLWYEVSVIYSWGVNCNIVRKEIINVNIWSYICEYNHNRNLYQSHYCMKS